MASTIKSSSKRNGIIFTILLLHVNPDILQLPYHANIPGDSVVVYPVVELLQYTVPDTEIFPANKPPRTQIFPLTVRLLADNAILGAMYRSPFIILFDKVLLEEITVVPEICLIGLLSSFTSKLQDVKSVLPPYSVLFIWSQFPCLSLKTILSIFHIPFASFSPTS